MSVLRVQRGPDTAGVLRRIVIEVDGEPVAQVGHGKTAEAAVSPGQHAVRARMDWHASPTITVHVADDETVTVQISYPLASFRKVLRRSDSAIRIARL